MCDLILHVYFILLTFATCIPLYYVIYKRFIIKYLIRLLYENINMCNKRLYLCVLNVYSADIFLNIYGIRSKYISGLLTKGSSINIRLFKGSVLADILIYTYS